MDDDFVHAYFGKLMLKIQQEDCTQRDEERDGNYNAISFSQNLFLNHLMNMNNKNGNRGYRWNNLTELISGSSLHIPPAPHLHV